MKELLGYNAAGSRVLLIGIKLAAMDFLVIKEAANLIGLEAEFDTERPAWQLVEQLSRPAIIVIGCRSATLLEVHEEVAAALVRTSRHIAFIILRDEVEVGLAAESVGDQIVFLSGIMSYPRLLPALIRCLCRLATSTPSACLAEPMSLEASHMIGLPSESPLGDRGQVIRAVADLAARMRIRRFDCFPGEIFGDPAWDILLSLAQAAAEGRATQASNIGLEARVPLSTSLRRIQELEEYGLVRRWADPGDKRREFVGLSNAGLKAFYDYAQIVLELASPAA
jgi:DNA-binding MarR family transcriptional regulator